jgi:hypothetical protein
MAVGRAGTLRIEAPLTGRKPLAGPPRPNPSLRRAQRVFPGVAIFYPFRPVAIPGIGRRQRSGSKSVIRFAGCVLTRSSISRR